MGTGRLGVIGPAWFDWASAGLVGHAWNSGPCPAGDRGLSRSQIDCIRMNARNPAVRLHRRPSSGVPPQLATRPIQLQVDIAN
jgi:hypothetical protein